MRSLRRHGRGKARGLRAVCDSFGALPAWAAQGVGEVYAIASGAMQEWLLIMGGSRGIGEVCDRSERHEGGRAKVAES